MEAVSLIENKSKKSHNLFVTWVQKRISKSVVAEKIATIRMMIIFLHFLQLSWIFR